MYFAFLDAFSHYPVPFRLNKEQFVRKFVEKLNIDFSLSVGAYDYEVLCGFIFTSINMYKGKLTAYNGGTGVKIAYRGNKLTSKMYDYLIPKFRAKGVRQCVLEVLVDNYGAIKVYEQIGFYKSALYYCFNLKDEITPRAQTLANLEIIKIHQPQLERYEAFHESEPSFLDSLEMIMENIANEEIIEARIDGETVGYAIFQPAFGRLSQIAVSSGMRRKGIGYAMIAHIFYNSHTSSLTAINIHEKDDALIKFMLALGFTNQLNQYEMILPVT